MTIQLLQYYNGQAPGVYTLAGAEETRLIGLGLARAYTSGMDGQNPVFSNAEQLGLRGVVSRAGKLLPRTRRLNRMLRAPFSEPQNTSTAIASGTWHMVIQSPVPFDGVRVLLSHIDSNAIAGVKVAAAVGGNYTGDKFGNSLTYVAGTFAGSATGTLPAGTAARPSRLLSDDILVQSVPRSDGGTGHFAYVRVYLPNGANPFSYVSTSNAVKYNALSDGAVYLLHDTAVDAIATPALLTTATSRSFSAIHGVEFITRAPSATLLSVGDSITRGQTTTTVENKNFTEYAANAANAAGLGCSFGGANMGVSSQTTAQFFARAQDLIPLLKPAIAIMPMGSPNDQVGTITQAIVDAQRAYAQRFIDLCFANGTLPVIWSQLPAASNKGYNAASEAFRVALNAELIATYGATVLVVDFSGSLGDNSTPLANLLAAYTGDGLHLQDVGHEAAGAVLLASVCRPVAAAI
jgi:lysophospholipase L1-like esterase